MALSPLRKRAPRSSAKASSLRRSQPARGEIRSNDLMGSLKEKTIADLVAKFRGGNAYVNVHTRAHPNGEIRCPIQ
jgi:hypothetical protein